MFSHGVICIYAIYLCVQVYLTLCGSMDCRPHGLLCPWNFPGKNTGAGCNFLLQRIFPTQGLNPCFFCFLHSAGGFFTTVPLQKPTHLQILNQNLNNDIRPDSIYTIFTKLNRFLKVYILRTWEFGMFYTLLTEKAMAPHSSTLAWKIPWTEEPGRLQSMGSRRVGHD